MKNKGIIGVWNLLIIMGSLWPARSVPDLKIEFIPHLDKLIHFVMYFVLAMLMYQGIRSMPDDRRVKMIKWAVLIYCSVLGFFLEILQKCFDLGRNFDTFDVLANVAGAVVAAIIYRIYNH